jgi:hypothetical protein
MLWAIVSVMCLMSLVQPMAAQVAAPAQPVERDDVSQSGKLKTLAVVAVERYDELIKDIEFLSTVAGRPETRQMLEGTIAFLTQGKGLTAIDKTQPWGVIVQTDGVQLLPIGCVPVKNLGDLLNVAANFQIDVKDVGDGVTELAHPEGRAVYVKEANGWAYIGPSPGALATLPEEPQAILGRLTEKHDFTVRFSVQNVPEMYRQFAIQAMQDGIQQGMQQKDDESDEEYQLRQQLAETQLAQARRAIEELDSLTLGWTIDAPGQTAHMDVTVQAVPGSRMAEELAAAARAKTDFAGFYQPNAAATMLFAAQTDPQQQDIAQIESSMAAFREQFNKQIDDNENIPDEMREDFKAAASDFFEAFLATAKSGRMDGGLTVEASTDSLTLVAGMLVSDTAKFESGLKKLEAAAKRSPEFSGIQWNAANHDGVAFHTWTVPVSDEHAAPRKLLGDEASFAVGIGPEAVYLAVGRNNLDAVKKAIDASAAQKGKSVPPFEFSLSLAPLADVLAAHADEGPQKAAIQSIGEMLRAEAQGEDHLRLTSRVISNGLQYRFEVEQGVLKALGKAAAEQQRQAQQANQ